MNRKAINASLSRLLCAGAVIFVTGCGAEVDDPDEDLAGAPAAPTAPVVSVVSPLSSAHTLSSSHDHASSNTSASHQVPHEDAAKSEAALHEPPPNPWTSP
jgi:hypothetical protein